MARHVSPNVPTVLLVESAQDDRDMYAEYLRASGLNPVERDNTGDALDDAIEVDLVVTGIRVKGPFDGIELIRRLRNGDGTRDLPVIVLTACAFERDERRARAAGCDVFLTKPCLPDRLVSEIRLVLTRRTLEAKLAPAYLRSNCHRRVL
jgi:two-component system, cell cycle response regulator DivK